MMHLQGRVFTRLNNFNSLPSALQYEANALQEYLTANQAQVFGKHHTLKLKTVFAAKAKDLLHTIDEWLRHQHGGHATGATAHTAVPVSAGTSGSVPTGVPVAGQGHLGITPNQGETNSGHVPNHVPPTASSHAKTLLEALVLKGFLTSQKPDKHASLTATEDLAFKDSELFVPLSKQIKSEPTPSTTVWDLADGAVFAGLIKHKAGLLEPLTHGKDVYAVVNARCKTLTLFKHDLSRKPLERLEAAQMKVAFDSTRYDHGVKVWTSTHTELLNAGSQQESDALVHALLAVGAAHEKRHFANDQLSPSELHDPTVGTRDGPHLGHHHGNEQPGENRSRLGHMFKKNDRATGDTAYAGAQPTNQPPPATYAP